LKNILGDFDLAINSRATISEIQEVWQIAGVDSATIQEGIVDKQAI
jgi:hypothetical protein